MIATVQKKQIGSGFLFAILIFLAPSVVSADETVIIDTAHDVASRSLGFNGGGSGNGYIAVKFTAPISGDVSTLTTYGTKVSAGVNFTAAFYTDTGGSGPGTIVGGASGTVIPAAGTCTDNVATFGSPVTLTASTVYWVVLSPAALSGTNYVNVCASGNPSTNNAAASTDGSTWSVNNDIYYAEFDIVGEAPTPTATTTITAVDSAVDDLYHGVILYMIGFWGVIWFFRKRT